MYSKMTLIPSALVASALALSGYGGSAVGSTVDPVQGQVYQSQHHSYRVVPVADGFVNPWAIAFLPGGDMLVTERAGRLRIIRNGSLLPEPVSGLPPVRVGGQGGLLDIALHPQFEINRLVYLSYAKPNADDSQGTTAVIRGRFENDRLTDVEEIFEAAAWTTGRGHHGSRLVFDREGYLFITVGDRQIPPSGDLAAHPAQNLNSHNGTVVRLHDDGRVPADNPFVGRADARPEIWSYGHRNPQGMTMHPETGEIWVNEHGPQGGDELNRVQRGANYGWPVVGFGVNYGAGTPIHQATRGGGFVDALHLWVPSIAPSGMLVYTGDRFPAWRGSFFIGALAGERLARLTLDGERVVNEETLVPGLARVRDVRQGPDGYIYLVLDDRAGAPSQIVRLEPVTSS